MKMVIFIIKHVPNASCESMTYLTYLIASQHLCISEWIYEYMFMTLK